MATLGAKPGGGGGEAVATADSGDSGTDSFKAASHLPLLAQDSYKRSRNLHCLGWGGGGAAHIQKLRGGIHCSLASPSASQGGR